MKEKHNITLQTETVEQIEQFYESDNCKCRSDFIDKAVRFYCEFILVNRDLDFMPNAIGSTMSNLFGNFEGKMSRLLFKIAVEISMLIHVFAATTHIDESLISQLRSMCIAEVRKTQGFMCFEEAVKFQKSND